MSDLLDQLSDTNTNGKGIASCADPTITVAAIAPGSTNPYLVYLSQLGVGSRRTSARISRKNRSNDE